MESTSDDLGGWPAVPQGSADNLQDEGHTSQEATEVTVQANAVATEAEAGFRADPVIPIKTDNFFYNGVTPKPGLDSKIDTFQLWYTTTDTFTIRFGKNKEEYGLPKAALIASFSYYENMFNHPFKETEENRGKLDEAQYEAFSTLIFWLKTGGLKIPGSSKRLAVTACLDAVITADYLGMTNMEAFVELVELFLTKHLIAHRTALTAVHLDLVAEKAFVFEKEMTQPIYNVFVSAAVKPFLVPSLQESTVGDAWATSNGRGESRATVAGWREVVKHYEALMGSNANYERNVSVKVREILRNGNRYHGELLQPIAEDKKKGQVRMTYVDVVTYWDPLFKHAEEKGKKARFTL